jgi:hypothetical protein
MASWGELRAARPDLADAGRELLYEFGVGLAFLATVRPDGGPRLHPMCPVLTAEEDELYAFVIPSPKRDDLRRDGRFALHCYPAADNEDAFYVTGRATEVDDPALRGRLERQYIEERSAFPVTAEDLADQLLFRFDIERCLVTRTTGHGDPAPRHEVWVTPSR